jgi:uncharacterized peroxidase-related enzyme
VPHIAVDPGKPGITGLLDFRPETARPLGQLAEALLRGPNSLTVGERELIATVVSRANECGFCAARHGAVAAAALEGGEALVERAIADPAGADLSDKVKALLRIALAVREDGHNVTDELVALAREAGTTDVEIHDTVLIAAAFCMFNRYVDGLGTVTPTDPAVHATAARRLLDGGYGGGPTR